MSPAARLVDTARRAAVRGAGEVAARVPAVRRHGSRAAMSATAEAARLRLRRDGDPRGALALLGPVLARREAPANAWLVAARAHEAAGDVDAALDAARRATSRPESSLHAFVLRRRLASDRGDLEEVAATLHDLASRPPADAAEASAVLRELAHGAAHELDAFAETVARARGDAGWVGSLRAEARLVRLHQEDPAAFDAEVGTGRAEPSRARAALRALAALDDWDRAAELAPGVRDADVPAAQLADSARRALKAGHAAPAAVLARRALDVRPGDTDAVRTVVDAEDTLRVAAYGLDVGPGAATPAYAPEPRHVLAVLAQSHPVRSGGYATRSHGILAGLRDLGWEPAAVTRLGFPYDSWPESDRRTVPPADVVDGITYGRLLGGPRERRYPQHPLAGYVARMADGIEQHAREHRAALLHASSFHANGLATARAARRLGLPWIYEMRGLEDLMKVSRDPGFAATDRYRFTTRLELEDCLLADRVLVITEALRDEMHRRGVPLEKIDVLPNGVHADRFAPRGRDRELEAELGVAGRTVIGYVGGLVDYEGLDLLVDAVAALRRERDDLHVLLVGDGGYEPVVRALVARAGLRDVVTMTGRVPHAQVARYLSLVDIAPFPRRPLPVCELISPIKPFEAMAMGTTPVVSSVAALTEIVRDGDTGLVFRKGDPADLARVLGRLLDDPGLRGELGERARAWVRAERDWSALVPIVDRVYRELLG